MRREPSIPFYDTRQIRCDKRQRCVPAELGSKDPGIFPMGKDIGHRCIKGEGGYGIQLMGFADERTPGSEILIIIGSRITGFTMPNC